MSKGRRQGTPDVKPVEKVELSQKNVALRIVATVVLVIIAVSSITYAVSRLIKTQTGRTEIEADAVKETNISNELVFNYEIGVGDKPANAEKKAITKLYTTLCIDAFRIFDTDAEVKEGNLHYLNAHPNEDVKVEDALYKAFELLQKYESRYIYAAPVHSRYRALFSCQTDSEAALFDPENNAETKEFILKCMKFANDPESVRIELYGDNKVRLCVSPEYESFAKSEGVSAYADFFMLRNAFATDYIADGLIAAGYERGVINSYDGYTRHLGKSGDLLAYNIFDFENKKSTVPAAFRQTEGMNIVLFRSHPLTQNDVLHYYVLEDGTVKTPYADMKDGMPRNAVNDFTAYSNKKGCAEIALSIYDIYASESLDVKKAVGLTENGIYSVWCENRTVIYTDNELKFENFDSLNYKKELVKINF